MSKEFADEVVRAWRESAAYWDRHRATIHTMFAPLTEALVEAADIEAGHRVLDVAGGPGEPSLSIAEIVGPEGLVVHTDVAPGMARAARDEAERLAVSNLVTAVAAGDAIPFADATFDRVVCRLGVMFFGDAALGLSEMVRVARPGGRVALVVWGFKENNPYFAIPSEAAGRYIPSPPDPPGAPGAWRFGDEGLLAGMLGDAGARDVVERRLAFEIAAPLSFDQFWTVRVEMSDTLRGKMAQLAPEDAERMKQEIREATGDFFRDHAMRFPAEALVVSGFRPAPGS